MNKQELEILKEQLTEHLIKELTSVIQEQIYKTVNGKIDSLRKEIQPLVDTFANLKWGEWVLVKMGIGIGGIIGSLYALTQIISFFQHK